MNSGVAFNNVYVLPTYQNSYGGGPSQAWADTIDGNFIPDYALDGSWGPALDGTPVRHWDSWYDYEETLVSARCAPGSPPRTTSTSSSRRV